MEERGCPKDIYERPGFWHSHRCGRRSVGEHGFCRIHSPEATAEREAKVAAKWHSRLAAEDRDRRKIRMFDEVLAALMARVETCGCHGILGFASDPYCERCVADLALIAKAEGK